MLFISATLRWIGSLLLKTTMDSSLVMGMIICSCLPLPTNMALILTASSKGDEALAIINSTIGNLLGVFVSPLLVLLYLHQSTTIDVARIYTRIFLRVLVPLFVGIIVRSFTPGSDRIALQNKHFFHSIREAAMIFIVFCLFSETFLDPPEIRTG
jgi:sodium/bile acid cotransporter 7